MKSQLNGSTDVIATRCDVDPIDKVRQHLRELEQMIVALPANTKDQSIAARRIRSMVGDQLAELTWWRPKCP